MRKLLFLLIIPFASCNSDQQEVVEPDVFSEAKIYSLASVGDDRYEASNEMIGLASFSQAGDVVTLEITLTGMTPNTSKAVHIHNGTVNNPGRHWNQNSFYVACNERSLGELWAKPFYGDVGNVPVDAEGNGSLTLRTDLWRINSGDERDVLNKTIIVHEMPQDFVEECDPMHDHNHGHSNPKIGGGTIELISDIPLNTQARVEQFHAPDFTICK